MSSAPAKPSLREYRAFWLGDRGSSGERDIHFGVVVAESVMLDTMAQPSKPPTVPAMELSGYGLMHSSLDEVVEAITSLDEGHCERRVAATGQSFIDVHHFLNQVTWPATRLAAFELGEGWTAIVDNRRGGSDPADLVRTLARLHPVMVVRVVDSEGRTVVQNGFRVRVRYEARIVEVYSGGVHQRSISCADDGGRWDFHLEGDPLAVEEEFDYDARRKRDRFTRDDLGLLLRDLGVRPVNRDELMHARAFTLLTEEPADPRWRAQIASKACTVEQDANPAYGYFVRGMSWVDHMATHASSVVADLEKAILLDPEFEPRCRSALERARAQLGKREYERALRNASSGLERA